MKEKAYSKCFGEGFVFALSYGQFYRRNPYTPGSSSFRQWEKGFSYGVLRSSKEVS